MTVADQTPATSPPHSSTPTPTPTPTADAPTLDVPADATCVEFLHLMKAFSESAVNVSEMAQRVDSLAHQDEQLLRLLPLASPCDGHGSTSGGSVADTTDDESCSRRGAKLDDDELDFDALDVDLVASPDDDDDDGFVSDDMDVDDDGMSMADDETDAASSQHRLSSLGDEDDMDDDEREDLQRWMELELDLDSTEDPYDAALIHLPGVGSTLLSTPPATAPTAAPTTVANAALGVTGSHANSSSVLSTTTTSLSSRFRGALFDRKAVTAALFEDDDEDDDDDDLVLMNALMRKKQQQQAASTQKTAGAKRPLDQESKTEDDVHIWGMEVDSYEHDLLSSIDHSVLCDRENRFLQWDLEIEAATAAAVAAAAVNQKTDIRTPPVSLSSFSTSLVGSSADSRQKITTASSPRDLKTHQPLRSPSNVDTTFSTEDWSSLDFGTFQNRTVSHILSSCLHKRKLHHPYKDRVTLVNFNVPGGEPIGPVPNHNAMTSVTGSLLFGAGLEAADVLMKSGAGGMGLLSSNSLGKDSKLTKSGEKKAKKPRVDGERKKSSKADPFDAFESFGDEDGRPGLAAKLAMTKLENLPLPDLTNLPQDLKELKRKIEATEHKVEGTKHRHRKGGPCPRCQVQNQLRAAKRAYHKRAVAHKKLPQLGAVSPALTATAVVVTPPPQAPVAAPSSPVVVPAAPVAATPAPAPAPTAAEPPKPVVAKPSPVAVTPAVSPVSVVRPATVPVAKPVVPTAVAASTPAPVAALVALPFPPPKAPVQSTPSTPVLLSPNMTAATAVATPSPFPRRSCGENALASPFSSPASVPSSASAPSSPESASASPQVHHVTVTSA